ncbi:MAG: DUF302 domain-containing protein [Pseudomonadales bacterium]|nr:DUF302 domain-containing protein [Pseudomonadales bacterium]
MSYYFNTLLTTDFESALAQVRLALEKAGFGIISDIDVAATFKKKLDLDFRPYRILGACNPRFAYQAISAEDRIGTMLPCNVLVQAREGGVIEVSAVDPVASMQAVINPQLGELARLVQAQLRAVIEGLH